MLWHASVHHTCTIILTRVRFRLLYLHDHSFWHAAGYHTCTIIPTTARFRFIIPARSFLLWHASVYHTSTIILTVARFRLSYLYNHTDCGTLPFIIPLQSYWLSHASVYHTSTIILTVARFRLSYLYNHTDCGTLPFIIPMRSYLQRTKQYNHREEKGGIIVNTCFSSKEEEQKARTELRIDSIAVSTDWLVQLISN